MYLENFKKTKMLIAFENRLTSDKSLKVANISQCADLYCDNSPVHME